MNYIAVDDEPFALKDLEEALAETAPDSVLQAFSIPSRRWPMSVIILSTPRFWTSNWGA